nr:alpha/beta hydrolase [Oscillochloris sp. ZM17-4]
MIEGPLRLIWGAGAAAVSLLALFEAPTWDLFRAAVVATEWGHLLALAALAPLLPGWRRTRAGQVGGALGIGAALVALTPLLRALPVAQALPAQLAAAFGPPPPELGRPAPLVAADLLRGVALPEGEPTALIFGEADGQRLDLDFYPAQGATAPAPLLVVVHGGAWQGGDKSEMPALSRYLAGRGYAVAAVNYRLAPRWPFPAARDDVRAAVAYLKGRAAELGVDPTRIALCGRSAGGQIALLVAYTADDPAIRGAISFYGPTDMVYGYAHPSNPLVLNSTEALEFYLGGPPERLPAAYAAASPISFVGQRTPPTLLIHGRRDELVFFRQSQLLDAALSAADRPHLLLDLPWATHAADFNFSGPSGQISTYAIEHFLGTVMLNVEL